MSENPCSRHAHWEYAGIYKRDQYGQIKRDKYGKRIYLPANETWACPKCNVVFINPFYKKRFKTRKSKTNGQFNHRTVSKILR